VETPPLEIRASDSTPHPRAGTGARTHKRHACMGAGAPGINNAAPRRSYLMNRALSTPPRRPPLPGTSPDPWPAGWPRDHGTVAVHARIHAASQGRAPGRARPGRQLHGRRRGRAPRLPRRARGAAARDHGRGNANCRDARGRGSHARPRTLAGAAPVGSLARPNPTTEATARAVTGQTKRVAAPTTRGDAIKPMEYRVERAIKIS
jgi:hypothetical protein